MTNKRRQLSKRTRFEVFKRDSFTCQYCGRKAPDVILHVDHVEPVAGGGSDSLINLVTSCSDCNGGKSDVKLDDSAAVSKQRIQLELLQQRREQIEMMVQWQKSLQNIDDVATEQAADLWSEIAIGWHLNEHGLGELRKSVRKYGLALVLDAMRNAANQYLKFEGDPIKATSDSVNHAWSMVSRICYVSKQCEKRPHLRDLYRIRAIARARCGYFNDPQAMTLLEEAHAAGLGLDLLERIARQVRNWTEWRTSIEELIDAQYSEESQ